MNLIQRSEPWNGHELGAHNADRGDPNIQGTKAPVEGRPAGNRFVARVFLSRDLGNQTRTQLLAALRSDAQHPYEIGSWPEGSRRPWTLVKLSRMSDIGVLWRSFATVVDGWEGIDEAAESP